LRETTPNVEVDIIKDYEITPDTRRARILMQTCAHISGAAFFYNPKKFNITPEFKGKRAEEGENPIKNLMGICLHPKYGGWFAMRSVFIFNNLRCDDLVYKEPIDSLNGDSTRIVNLIKAFNYNWKDSTYRDWIEVEARYSKMQLDYFLLEPKFRKALIIEWLAHDSVDSLLREHHKKERENYLMRNFFII
jgi:methylmalonic aciduria homocystinuria type C protein